VLHRSAGETLRECLRLLTSAVKCFGTLGGGGSAAAGTDNSAEELHQLQTASAALVRLHPPAAAPLLQRLCGSWPTGDTARETAFLSLAGAVLGAAPPLQLVLPHSTAPRQLFKRVAACVRSPCVRVVQAAASFVQQPVVLQGYLAPQRELMQAVTAALAGNRAHWSPLVRELSEQTFDMLLDFC
jgi:Protein phosphatase 2A regulatory B subunit (B56 family)